MNQNCSKLDKHTAAQDQAQAVDVSEPTHSFRFYHTDVLIVSVLMSCVDENCAEKYFTSHTAVTVLGFCVRSYSSLFEVVICPNVDRIPTF